jgi:toxin-antitoxin system PIN domain toxin
VILADVNLLVYGFDSDSPLHASYAPWLARALAGPEEFALIDSVLSGFVRIVTHPKIMPNPAPTERALAFVDSIASARASRWLPASANLWHVFARFVEGDAAIKGNLVPDAYLAASALTHGARLATADRGFARYPRLRWFDPARSLDSA